jgi:hypothetical protein
MSISIHSTRFPKAAKQEETPPVREVFPVPPLPDVTTMAQLIASLPEDTKSFYHKTDKISMIFCAIYPVFSEG